MNKTPLNHITSMSYIYLMISINFHNSEQKLKSISIERFTMDIP